MTMDAVVVAQGLTKTYGSNTVVKNIHFTVKKGQFCGILGPNGAGKTTTLRMLMGSTPPTSGELQVMEWAVPQYAREMRAKVGIVPQRDNLDPDFSVVDNLLIYGSYFGISRKILRDRIPKLLEFAALQHKADALVPTLSGGMQRRLSLARALVNAPDLLVLDEPTTGLDPQARQLIWQRLRQLKNQGLTLILTTHYMEEAERLCDHLIIMDNGSILEEATPRDLVDKYIEPQVVEVHGNTANEWHDSHAITFNLKHERVGDTWFYYGNDMAALLDSLSKFPELRYLHRPANLEDVFVNLTGRDLRDD